MKILMADDDLLVLNALKTILEKNNIEVMGYYTNPNDLFEMYSLKKPDVVILDIRMKEFNGVDIAIKILNFDPLAKILLLTTFNDEKDILRALEKGVLGIILKDNIASLIPAIQSVSLGNKIIDSSLNMKNIIIEEEKNFENLTDKENEILKKVADGLSNREIAEKLFLSEGTVRNYISVILEKLNLRDRTQLAIHYYKNN
ncbi:MAG: response regulator transcription factor [Peptoniphilaceae bacterium]|uniref:response regulator transcription factor n=1 Tax=Parvimonas sp. TaxID=1944660 RepID=UPI0025DD4856|nr:response regulator transcription factor [Parvimonas sp.]MCI5998065.1 response regulator transcription factor [Parvimonas sp.]MDD7764685.1 response regulator transcription factor [Peptoniphilaceae bacterium]MDY3050176.1 response regulator transcription factor [Parvimonas sp.]